MGTGGLERPGRLNHVEDRARFGLARSFSRFVHQLRTMDLAKLPGIAETINWVAALELLGIDLLDGTAWQRTLGSVMKYREDLDLGYRLVVGG